jgi:hypothetical protein
MPSSSNPPSAASLTPSSAWSWLIGSKFKARSQIRQSPAIAGLSRVARARNSTFRTVKSPGFLRAGSRSRGRSRSGGSEEVGRTRRVGRGSAGRSRWPLVPSALAKTDPVALTRIDPHADRGFSAPASSSRPVRPGWCRGGAGASAAPSA